MGDLDQSGIVKKEVCLNCNRTFNSFESLQSHKPNCNFNKNNTPLQTISKSISICVCGCSLGHHKASKSEKCAFFRICNCKGFISHHKESLQNRYRKYLHLPIFRTD